MPPTTANAPSQQQLTSDQNKPSSINYETWTLFYRHGVNPHCQKGFIFRGTIQEANARAKKHCEIMNYRFVFVRPMLVDLESEEFEHKKKEGLL